ncbi:MAG: Rieske 2Fe-2S domain-containing protein [Burkholderiales bacterium]
MFLLNQWYVAAWDREVTRDKPFARTILNQPIVFYRRADGTPGALEDRCCHRHAQLSLGVVVGDDLRCGYHGLKFDATGNCNEIPGQNHIPPDARIRSYPILECWNWIWIWLGDPAMADKSLIPNWWWTTHPDWANTRPDPFHMRCHYQLINDNVLDVTHLAYVHASSIGSAAINEFPMKTERLDGKVRMTRWIIDRPAPPMYQNFGQFKGNVDRWQIVEHQAPCFSVNFAGCADTGTGAPQGDKAGKRIDLMALSAPTPESEDSTHYFFCFVRSFNLDDPATEKMFAEDFVKVFREDVVVIEAQHARIKSMPNAPQISIAVDAAPMAARRILDEMLNKENSNSR